MRKLYSISTIICLFLSLGLNAQEREPITVPLSNPGQKGTLKVDTHNGQISVTTHSKQEVEVILIKASKNKEPKGNKRGLKRIAKQDLDVTISEDNNRVSIDSDQNSRIDMKIKLPENFSVKITTHHNGDIEINGVTGEIEAQAHHGGIRLEDVSGSVVANTHHGSVIVNLLQIDNSTPMAFTTYHGDVDISFPASLTGTLKMKSSKGEIYTDFDIVPLKTKIETVTRGTRKEIKLEGWTHGECGGGGEEMTFKTYHGDVIIRKNKN